MKPRGFVFDLATIPVMGKTYYNPGTEPATKKCKMYLVWLLILLGSTWNLLGDEINFVQMAGLGLQLSILQQVLLLPLQRYSATAQPSQAMGHFSFSCAWYLISQ